MMTELNEIKRDQKMIRIGIDEVKREQQMLRIGVDEVKREAAVLRIQVMEAEERTIRLVEMVVRLAKPGKQEVTE